MVVEVKLFATFRKERFNQKELEISEECSLSELLKQLRISTDEVGILLVNGRQVLLEQKLAPHDVVSVFPLIGGG